MFTTPAPAAPTVSASAISPSGSPIHHLRPSRLRDLSASLSLRSYRSRDSPAQSPQNTHTPGRRTSQSSSAAAPSSSSAASSAVDPSASTRAVTTPRAPPLTSHNSEPSAPTPPPSDMTRTRVESAPQMSVRNQPGPVPTSPMPSSDDNHGESNSSSTRNLPSIRLIPHQDPRPGRPSLQFPTMSRTLPTESHIIRVGRYSERDNAPEIASNVPSSAPIGFKSKVVSRKHYELWCNESQWYIKDVGSSSGTFLNRIRLSQPNQESKPFAIKDGDIIQLGIDFRGGEEMIFRCVKIRVECNRGWQRNLNTFNKQTHQHLRNLGKNRKEADSASQHTSECVICLMSIAPCQSLFVAPCSHVWHYKCIRPILNGPTWPNFLCPNCRAVADLEADVEDMDLEDWDNSPDHSEDQGETAKNGLPTNGERPKDTSNDQSLSELAAAMSNYTIEEGFGQRATSATPQRQIPTAQSSSASQPVNIGVGGRTNVNGLSPDVANRDRAADGPLTPRNNVGPFVLDGSAGRTHRHDHYEHYEPLTISVTSPFSLPNPDDRHSFLNPLTPSVQADPEDRQPLATNGSTPSVRTE